MYRGRRGITEIISTVIIISAMLLIAITTLIISNNMFNYQSQNVEFEQAKNIMVNLASIIEGISGRQGAAGYVRFNTVTGGPEYLADVGTLVLMVGNGTINRTIYTSTYDLLRYRGGSLVGVSGLTMLRGTMSSIILNSQYPLGSVYVVQENGAYVVMNFSRVNVIKMGLYNFTKGVNQTDYSISYEALNLIEIHYIDLIPGSFSGTGSINTVARTINVTTQYIRIGTPPDGIISVYLNNYRVDLNVEPGYDTLVIFVLSKVEISMFGG